MIGKLKLRDEIAERLFEDLIYKAAGGELDQLDCKLEDLIKRLEALNVKEARRVVLDIETAAGSYAAALAEAAFLAGLECGSDLRRLVCKTDA